MRHRLQFSLLGLLLLTVAIAVGVKLWYGPHHVINPFDDDPFLQSLEKQKLSFFNTLLTDFFHHGKIEYHYYNVGTVKRYSPAILKGKGRRILFEMYTLVSSPEEPYLVNVEFEGEQPDPRYPIIRTARVACVITNAHLNGADKRLYFLSDAGQIFQLEFVGSFYRNQVVLPESVPNDELGRLILSESTRLLEDR